MAKIPDLNDPSRDVIGVGIDGNGNIVGKNISVVRNEVQRNYGLTLLPSNYFEDHKATQEDLDNWKKGFSFNKIESIKANQEFRRDRVLNDIKRNLQKQHRLLTLGESGTSKSTILMEIICDFFDKGYKILYNFGASELKDGVEITRFLEGLLKGGNKVLVAVDNVHDERTAAIFYVMDQLSNYYLKENILFILTARIPEFDWFIRDRLSKVKEIYRESVRKFEQYSNFRYDIPYFTEEEIVDFRKAYQNNTDDKSGNLSDKYAEEIYNATEGQPIMVKFAVLGQGLQQDVKFRYDNYLKDPANVDQPDVMKMQTMLVCSLLHIANLKIKDKLLEDMKILRYAFKLNKSVLKHTENSWETIHPAWDLEMLSFLYNVSDEEILYERREYLKNAINLIFDVKDSKMSTSVIESLYMLPLDAKVPTSIVEAVVELPDYLSYDEKRKLSSKAQFSKGYALGNLGKFTELLNAMIRR